MRSTLFPHCPLARELDPPKFLLIAISPLGISSPQIAPKSKLFLLSILTLNTLQHSSSSPQRAGLTRTRRAATDSTFGLSACSPGSRAPSGRVKSTVGPNALDAADKPDEVSRHSIFPFTHHPAHLLWLNDDKSTIVFEKTESTMIETISGSPSQVDLLLASNFV